MNNKECDFCEIGNLEWRTINLDQQSRSFVSNPSFRKGHCLVIPNRHITLVNELTPEESQSIFCELGRLGMLLDEGFGSGIMQKYQPTQPKNGIKVNHLHFHVFPRFQIEPGLFPVPDPNEFAGFSNIDRKEVIEMAGGLR